MSTSNGPRPTKVILAEALDELREREKRLKRVGDELRETRAAIRELEKRVGAQHDTRAPVGQPRVTAPRADSAPTGQTHTAIMQAVRGSLDPLTIPQIAQKIGREPAGWLSAQVARLVNAGDLVDVTGGRYALASALAAPETTAA